MPLLAVTYLKGRPGVTTTALGLAIAAPVEARATVVECDPAGGDVMRRLHLAATPSLVDVAAAARGATDADTAFAAGVQPVTVGNVVVSVVAAPAGGGQTRAALPELTGTGRAALTAPDRLVVADCGRLSAGAAAWPLLGLADVVLVMARARADELAHVRESLAELVDVCGGRLVVLLAAGGVYPAAEVAQVLQTYVAEELARHPSAVEVLGPLPDDRKTAALLGGELLAGKRWRHLPLMRAYAALLDDLNTDLTVTPPAGFDPATREGAKG
ncbi:MinD-like ATPase involved in chromosome partitioning or flagellar assembly [Actinoplanes lutulentus]|uniref:MinD-like ATPase involved in chromosome partitioning or flagellar assembly n=1 Tax=Actinoplanes lutulentus TaxID=1287878 RepID=A0A327Z1B0_9ACTN|nr:hypothetical protein [Actinoplanes lutulentus]MBB2943261.1 MinD-like ATPase involved in chromosome partitioning or flagellar assembly [Actinoplanes lutulentus]RAK28322.1 hypothetical protein B0I29_12090 [Actinoplanes lutulentus]